jgi:hypothetical protein
LWIYSCVAPKRAASSVREPTPNLR